MTQEKALRMALEFIERVNKDGWILADFEDQMYEVITDIKEVLAQPEQIQPSVYSNTHQPEQEPVVGTKTWFEDGKVVTQYLYPSDIYTTPPQPEQEPCDMKDMCIGCSPRNADGNCPDAQQEPVAWLHVMDNTEGLKANGTGIVLITQKRKHPFGKPGIDFSKSYPVTSTPLYTTPPQRKPLTDEQLNIIGSRWHLNLLGADEKAELFAFARAIEAAHGIKE